MSNPIKVFAILWGFWPYVNNSIQQEMVISKEVHVFKVFKESKFTLR
jgi:hypothetical protein